MWFLNEMQVKAYIKHILMIFGDLGMRLTLAPKTKF